MATSPNISNFQPVQVVGSTTAAAAAGASVTLAVPANFPTSTLALAGVTISCGISTATAHGIWTISDGVWTQSYYILMSPTIPALIDLDFAPGLTASAEGKSITITVPTIASGAPYAIAAQAYLI